MDNLIYEYTNTLIYEYTNTLIWIDKRWWIYNHE